jgi:16S rRNA processing protein RimM
MVVLGRIIAPFGVQGWLKVVPMGDDPEAWRAMPAWWLGSDADGEEWQRFDLDEMRLHGKGLVVKLKGVDDRTAAEALDGRYIAAPREALPQAGADEYYWVDLIGLRVTNEQGAVLGTVAELLETGAHDVLVVREGEGPQARKRLLPFIAQVVKDVDVAGGVIRVDWQADW